MPVDLCKPGEVLVFRTRHEPTENATLDMLTAVDFAGDPGKTLQAPTEDADINVLMKRMGVKDGSVLPYFPDARALYGDFSEFPNDPVELATIMRQGELAFLKLPADLRERYGTPEKLFRFMANEDNYDEAVKLGLLEKRKDPQKTPIDTLVDKIDQLVSSSTGSDKEIPVPTSNKEK